MPSPSEGQANGSTMRDQDNKADPVSTTTTAAAANKKDEPADGATAGPGLQLVVSTDAANYTGMQMKPWRRRLVMLSLCLTLFLGALDITIISTALPTVARELHIDAQQYAWVGSGYNLANTASMLVWTKVSDIFGRKPIIMAAASFFMVGSVVCARSVSSTMLIGGRVIQGLGGGGSFVLTTVIISDIFPLEERAKYYGMTGMVWGIAAAIGPILGGVFAQAAGWRWCFYINLPVDGIALVFIFFFLKVDIKKIPFVEGIRSLDWTGFVLVIGGTICFLYGLEVGASNLSPWGSAKVICLILFGFILLALFMVWEATMAKVPIIPFRVFQERNNIAAYAVACLHSFVFISFDFFLPLYFQMILEFKPIISAVTLFALIFPLSAATMSGSVIIRKTGYYKFLIVGGSAIMCLGNGLFILLGPTVNWPKVILFQIVAGLGAGGMFQSPMIALQNYLRQRDTAMAMAAYSFLRNLFTSMSIVIGTVLMQRSMKSGSFVTSGGQGGIDKDEYMNALHVMWAFYTGVTGLLLIAGFFIRQKPVTSPPGSGSDAKTSPKVGTGDDVEKAVQTDIQNKETLEAKEAASEK
ncbi:unnamed protein product [Clonostachys byssicola]|uniref:Major facilitator superfamily (MFS) profile domain-containing protein n=1 Tax=Clonostachys byssicola TaxID=160290 RepID=A0A9N9U2L8_9HYPO|nr:unnamed protein product [Clonostachys byssicola]